MKNVYLETKNEFILIACQNAVQQVHTTKQNKCTFACHCTYLAQKKKYGSTRFTRLVTFQQLSSYIGTRGHRIPP